MLIKYIELWNNIKDPIKTINDKPDEYGKQFYETPHNMTIVVRSVFQEDNKYYPQFFRWIFRKNRW